ncbi:hypothetical protein MUK42_35730, partial [Musa troglodytarum]
MSPGDNIPTDGVAVVSDVLGWGVEVKLGSLLGLVVDRHVRGTPRAPRVHRRDEHVEEADRAPGDGHCRGQRLGVAAVAVAVLAPVGRHGGGGGYRPGGRRRGAVGEAASRGPLFAAGALEGGLHLLEGAHAAVTQGCRRRPLLQKEGGGGSRGEREVEVVAMASHRIMVALLEAACESAWNLTLEKSRARFFPTDQSGAPNPTLRPFWSLRSSRRAPPSMAAALSSQEKSAPVATPKSRTYSPLA